MNKAYETPEGFEFIRRVWELEDACQSVTDSFITDNDNEVQSRINGLGSVLEWLQKMGSCFWGCNDEDHAVVYLCARVASNGHSAMRLLRMGYYDESLLVSRGIGEIANLLALFSKDDSTLNEYRESRGSWESAWRKFGPGEVRRKLGIPPIDDRRYYALSARSAHARPDLSPQSFNFLKQPSVGTIFQQIGFLVSLNELVHSISHACIAASSLLNISDEVKQDAEHAARDLLDHKGKLDLGGLEEMYGLVTIVVEDESRNGG